MDCDDICLILTTGSSLHGLTTHQKPSTLPSVIIHKTSHGARLLGVDWGEIRQSGVMKLKMNAFYIHFFSNGSTATWGPRPPIFRGYTITLRQITLGRTPLDE
jgi:hypothetical protein